MPLVLRLRDIDRRRDEHPRLELLAVVADGRAYAHGAPGRVDVAPDEVDASEEPLLRIGLRSERDGQPLPHHGEVPLVDLEERPDLGEVRDRDDRLERFDERARSRLAIGDASGERRPQGDAVRSRSTRANGVDLLRCGPEQAQRTLGGLGFRPRGEEGRLAGLEVRGADHAVREERAGALVLVLGHAKVGDRPDEPVPRVRDLDALEPDERRSRPHAVAEIDRDGRDPRLDVRGDVHDAVFVVADRAVEHERMLEVHGLDLPRLDARFGDRGGRESNALGNLRSVGPLRLVGRLDVLAPLARARGGDDGDESEAEPRGALEHDGPPAGRRPARSRDENCGG